MPAKTKSGISLESCLGLIRDIPDFPKPGVVFKDITPLLKSGPHFRFVVEQMARICEENHVRPHVLACPEARGFIFGSALAYRLGVGFIPIRKPKKLPYLTSRIEYALEYGTDSVEMHVDAIEPGQDVVLIDDLLATGGTTRACAELVESLGARVQACVFLIELAFLQGRKKIERYPIFSLIHF